MRPLLLLLLMTSGVAAQELQWSRAKLCQDVSPASLTSPWHGGAHDVLVTDSEPCKWVAVSPQSWITVQGSVSGVNGETVTVVLAPNRSEARSGSITIGARKIVITQKKGRP